MGRSLTPFYAIEVATDNGHWTPAAWQSKQAGRPTAKNLARHVALLEAATQPGGVNAHLGATKILAARIVTNRGAKKLVAGYVEAGKARWWMGWLVAGVTNPEGVNVALGEAA